MRAKYVGNTDLPADERGVPDTFEMFGIEFEKGKFAEVPDNLAAKFEGNSHFVTSGNAPDEAKAETK